VFCVEQIGSTLSLCAGLVMMELFRQLGQIDSLSFSREFLYVDLAIDRKRCLPFWHHWTELGPGAPTCLSRILLP
jgi:hypothetical protein